MDKVFKEEQLIFTGLVDKLNVLKVFLSDDSGYVVMVENAGGLSCIYFNGSLGMKINKSTSEDTLMVHYQIRSYQLLLHLLLMYFQIFLYP